MPAITSLGIGSGVDINSMVTQLVALESKPLVQMKAAASSLQTQISSYGKLNSLFGALQSASNKLNASSLWARSIATSSDETAVSAVGGSSAATGSYTVKVERLAGSQTVVSGTSFPNASELVGSGSLSIETGGWEDRPPLTFVPTVGGGGVFTVDVTSTDTLQTLRDKINAADAGVSASIITDSSGARLSIRSKASGEDNGFRITVQDDDGAAGDGAGLSRFGYDPENGVSDMALKQAAQDAQAVVNGITVNSASNDVSGVIEGLTLRLKKQTTGDVTLGVASDTESVKSAITAFATAYNDLAKAIAEQTKYDPASKVGGPLQGDSTVGSLLRQLREVLNSPSGASTAFARLSDVGLEMQRDGTLQVDSAKLDSATANLPELKKAFSNLDAADSANDGFARRYAQLATQVLGVDGSLTTRTEGLRDRLARNSTDQDKLSARIERYQQRLVAQYTAMDANLSKLNSLQGYLTQQLNSLSKLNSSSNSGS